MPLDHLDAGAAPLQNMDWLIADPVQTVALWGSGVAVNVPQPARFAAQKLILAQKRDAGLRMKRQKDLLQADALINALLANDPYALIDTFSDACTQGSRGWAQPLERSLRELDRKDVLELMAAA